MRQSNLHKFISCSTANCNWKPSLLIKTRCTVLALEIDKKWKSNRFKCLTALLHQSIPMHSTSKQSPLHDSWTRLILHKSAPQKRISHIKQTLTMCQIAPTWTLTIDNEPAEKRFVFSAYRNRIFMCGHCPSQRRDNAIVYSGSCCPGTSLETNTEKRRNFPDIGVSSMHFNDLSSDWVFSPKHFSSLRRCDSETPKSCLTNRAKSSEWLLQLPSSAFE